MKETVVLVHGLWMMGPDMALLRVRLRRCGFHVVQFSYPTVRKSVRTNAARLQQFVQALDAQTVHFVGHSLGGLVILQLFQDFPQQRPGRIVLLGTPYTGSYAARYLVNYAFWRWVFGKSFDGGLLGNGPVWDGGRKLGVIAGTLRLGAGLCVRDLATPNDGTVILEETHIPGMTDHITLPATHMGLLLSPDAAQQVCAFLKSGRFVAG